MTNKATSRTRLQSAVLLLLIVALNAPVSSAQDTPSQRRVSGAGSASPLDQLRYLMQLQQQDQQPLPTAEQLQNSFNLTDEQLKLLKDALKRSGLLSDIKPPVSPIIKQQPQREPLSDLERLRQEITQPEAGDRFPAISPPTRQPSRSETPQPEPITRRPSPVPQTPTQIPPRPTAVPQQAPRESQAVRRTQKSSVPNPPSSGFTPELARQLTELQQRWNRASQQTQNAEFPSHRDTGSNEGPSFDIGQELSRGGLRNTMKKLVRDIQKKVQQDGLQDTNGDSSAPGRSTWNQALVNVLDRVREDVVETVRESRKNRADKARTQRNRSRSQRRTAERSGSSQDGDLAQGGQSPQSTESSTQSAQAQPTLTTRDSSPQEWGPAGAPSTFAQVLVILVGLGIAAAALLWTSRRQEQTRLSRHNRTLQPVSPQDIHAPEDIIRAFHWLTLGRSPDAAEWWNHLQAEKSLSLNSPGQQEALQQLARLYELARYQQNSDVEIDPGQIQQARTALAGCLS